MTMHELPELPLADVAMLGRLDASLRWYDRRARLVHIVARAGALFVEGASHSAALWGLVPTCALFPDEAAEAAEAAGQPSRGGTPHGDEPQ